jgi:hypothetical protein
MLRVFAPWMEVAHMSSWSHPILFETLAMAFDGPALTPKWQALLKNGGSIAAVVPVGERRYTLSFRQPARDGHRTETDDAFRERMMERKALAIINKDWLAAIEEWKHLQETERQLQDHLKQKTEMIDGLIDMLQAITNDQRSRYYAKLHHILDKLEALDARLDSIEAAQSPLLNNQVAINGRQPRSQGHSVDPDVGS